MFRKLHEGFISNKSLINHIAKLLHTRRRSTQMKEIVRSFTRSHLWTVSLPIGSLVSIGESNLSCQASK